MVIFLLQITPSVQQRREVLDILHHVKGPISADLECESCAVYELAGEDPAVLYLERWKSVAAVQRHIQSALFARILSAMDLSAVQPEIRFYEISRSWGLELVQQIRGQRAPDSRGESDK